MNQPINQAVGHQPLTPQNASFDNLTAEERYKLLANGTDSFKTVQESENREVQFQPLSLRDQALDKQ
ncbi:17625_t:CDS:1, partial [Cetraspora pellucida]